MVITVGYDMKREQYYTRYSIEYMLNTVDYQ